MASVVAVQPSRATPGQTVRVRVVVGHPHENGLRRNAEGERITRNTLRDLVCRYDGRIVFRASLGSGIAANPYLVFEMRAVRTGRVEMQWEDESGARGGASATLEVDV